MKFLKLLPLFLLLSFIAHSQIASISGPATICDGSCVTYSDATSGGSWSSSNYGIATIGSSSGVACGLAAGTVTFTYTVGAGFVTYTATVNPSPAAIIGPGGVCFGGTSLFTDATSGGSWSTSNTAIVSITSGSGLATGIVVGSTANISYTLPTGCFAITPVTVVASPASITGSTSTVCTGGTITLSDATTGGTWSSSNVSIATVSGSGVVTGLVAGTATISYTLSSGCYATYPVTVVTSPAAISGPSMVCTGSSITLTDATSGGTWSSRNTSLATVGSSSGIVTSASAGTDTIIYTLSSGCSASATLSVAATVPAISGPSSICVGSTATLLDAASGGTWSSSSTVFATTGSASGVVSGIAVGVTTITYTITSGCYATTPLSVNAVPSSITGALSVCAGQTTTLSSTTTGGTWASSNTAIATVGSSGIVTGVSAGVANITYTIATGCYAVAAVTVTATPAAISGASSFCVGTTITLTDATGGGTWTSSSVGVATVGSATGIVTGVTVGTTTITYMLSSGCYATKTVSVLATPAPLTGSTTLCVGGTTTLSSTTGGGAWSSSNPGVASISPLTAVITGVSAGTSTISYTISTTGCSTFVVVTVNAAPAAITGTASVCVGGTTTLSDATSGGTFSSSNTAEATVGISTGIVTGVSLGTPVITYTLPTGCFTSLTVTVVPASVTTYTVTGGGSYCSGSTGTVNLSGSQVGVTYTLLNGGTVITSLTGTGAALAFSFSATTSGTYTVVASYGTSCSSTMSGSASVTINTLPPMTTVTGGGSYCSGGSGVVVGGSTSATGVTYQLMNGTIPVGAPIAGTGGAISFGLQTAAGTYTIVETATVSGCTVTTTTSVTVAINPLPTAYMVSGGGSYCSGSGLSITLSGSTPGINYQVYLGGSPVGSPLTGTGFSLTFGPYTTAGTYTVVATNPTTGCAATMTGSATITLTGTAITSYTVTGGGSYCSGGTGVTVGLSGSQTGITYQLYNGSTAVGSAISGTGSALSFGLQTAAGTYTVVATNSSSCTATMTGSAVITVNPLPTAFTVTGGGSYCSGSGISIGLSGSAVATSYSLFNGTTMVASVSGTGSVVSFGTFTTPGTYTATGTSAVTGCLNNMTGSAVITSGGTSITSYSVTGGGSYCSGGAGVAVGLGGSQTGMTYQLYNGSTAVGSAVSGTGSAISFGLQTTVGTYTVVATNSSSCTATMSGSAVIIVNPLPTVFTVTGGGSYCSGGSGVTVGLSGSQTGISYQLYNGTTMVSTVTGTGSAISFGLLTAAGTYTVVASNATTGCTATMSGSAVITISSSVTVYTVTGGGSYCSGGAGVAVGLSGSQTTVSYQLYNGGSAVGATVAGTGSALSFGLQTAAGTYTVVANPGATCATTMTGSAVITVNPLPAVYTVTGGGSYCSGGTGVTVGLSNSQAGVNYQLYNGSSLVGAPVAGTGSAISFGLQTAAGTYTVTATFIATSCTAAMSGSAVITINPLPTVFTVTGGGAYCSGGAGVNVGLSNSQAGVNYQLYNGGAAVGSAVAGTGAAISFGLQTAAGTYTVVATNASTGCSNNMSGSVAITINPLPTVFTVTGGGTYCSGSGVAIGLSGSQTGVSYQLYNGVIPVGSAVTGTGGAIGFGTFTAAGVYTVSATNIASGCTNTMSGSATVSISVPPVVYTVTGGGSYCSGGAGFVIGLSNSQSGVSYQLYNGTTAVGIPIAGTGSAISFGLQTAAGTYTVTANPGSSCATAMSGSATIIVITSPTVYTVTGGGAYCLGGVGAAVNLSNSQAGVSYQLYNGGVATGSPVAGTGSAIGFGFMTTAGVYTVAANPGTTCSATMSGSATVTVYTSPATLPAVIPVTGGGGFCSGGTGVAVTMPASAVSINYQLYRSGTPVGSPVPGAGTAISFGLQTVPGSYTVVATSTISGCSANMSGSATVATYPAPTAYNVTGGGSFCAGGTGVDVGLSGSASGVNYRLYRGGVAVGTSLPGTGAAISFGAQTVAGTYTAVATNTSTFCTANMTGSATVSVSSVTTYTVTGGGSYCTGGTGVHINLNGSSIGVNYQLYRGTTLVGPSMAGTGLPIDFGLQTATGTYTVLATSTTTSCSGVMAGSATVSVSPLPTTYTVTGGGSYCSGSSGVIIGLSGSQVGTSYQLFNGTTAVGSAIAGTGGAISFGAFTTAGTYTVSATITATGCTAAMSGSATITVSASPALYTVTGGGSYCAGSSGVHILLSGSATGVSYQLYLGTTATGSPVAGTGLLIDFGPHTVAGTYTVRATNTTGCTVAMTGSATIAVTTAPTVMTVTGGGSYCSGGTGVHVRLSSSTVGINYQLYRSGVSAGIVVAGTGGVLDFGLQTAAGIYTVVATNPTTGCSSNMAGSATVVVNALPTVYTVTGGGSYCAGGAGAHVLLCGSNTGVNYKLYLGGVPVSGSPVAGTGLSLDFGARTSAGVYTVIATNATTGCTNNMSGSVTVTITPLPTAGTISGPATVHNGHTITLTDGVAGGVWTSSTPTVAIVGSLTGIVTGVAAGYTNISYSVTNSCGTARTVYTIHDLGPAPPPRAGFTSGNTSICVGGTTTLSNSVSGGEWSSSNNEIASIDPQSGKVKGVSAGIAAITYTLNTASDIEQIFTPVTVNDAPDALSILASPGTSIAAGQQLKLYASVKNGAAVATYQWLLNRQVVQGATDATFTGTDLSNNDEITCVAYGECGNEPVSASVIIKVIAEQAAQVKAGISDIKVIPNPNKGQFSIKGTITSTGNETAVIVITDVLGQVVYSNNIPVKDGIINESIQLNNAANGMYLLTIQCGADKNVFHIVVEQ